MARVGIIAVERSAHGVRARRNVAENINAVIHIVGRAFLHHISTGIDKFDIGAVESGIVVASKEVERRKDWIIPCAEIVVVVNHAGHVARDKAFGCVDEFEHGLGEVPSLKPTEVVVHKAVGFRTMLVVATFREQPGHP